ncbi:hypothetical protein ACVW00_001210 [Marmoricola sp. URHA0025 HA25]
MRIYLPTTLPGLAAFVASGQVPAGGDRYLAAEESEEAEYDALAEAADAAAELLDGPGRRVVLVADVPDADAGFPMALVAAVHADTADVDPVGADLPDLGWYAVQEIGDLLA